MSRALATDTALEIQKSMLRPFHLFQGDFNDGTVRFTDNTYDLELMGATWLSVGHLIAFDTVEESGDLQATGCTINLSGMNEEVIALVVDQDLADKPITIYRGFFDPNNAIITPVQIFRGRSDGGTFSENTDDGTSVVSLRGINQFVDYEKVNGRRTNDKEQQFHYPGDRFCKFIAELTNKVIEWE